MSTTTITTTEQVMTLVNVFTCVPEHQQELVDVLAEATGVMRGLPGFVSANVHRSVDGARVVNYVQWRTRDDFESMLQNPMALPHMGRAAELATYDPIVCDVVHVGHA